jgi:Sulfatase
VTLPSLPWRYAHLAALWSYGVSQPVFSMLQANPEFLVVRGSTRSDVVLFALILALVPPLLVIAAEAAASLVSETLARALHIVAIWCFAFLTTLQLVRLLDPARGVTLLLPLVPAALAAAAYVRWRPFRSFLSLSLALPVMGLLAFVGTVPLAVDDAPGADVRVATPAPVVLVVFDEFPVSSLLRPDGTIDAVRYPNFARLAADATWYPRATTSHGSTTHAVPVILTGQLPRQDELPTLEDHPENVFTLLGERYAVRSAEQATRLCPSRYCPRTRQQVPLVDRQRGLLYDVSVGYLYRVLPRSMRAGLPPIGERWGGFGGGSDVDVRELVLGALDSNAWNAALAHARGRKPAQFEGFLRSLGPARKRSTLYFEHALLPHTPWAFLPSGREYGDSEGIDGIDEGWVRWRSSRPLVDQALQRHLLQVGYVDRLVGRLVDRLKATGLYDRALVIVTADHGVSFRPGGYMRDVERADLADIAGVPLFVRYPGERAGRVDRRDAKTIDIFPTIADVVGVQIPWHVDGRSLRTEPVSRPVSVQAFGQGQVTADSDVVAREVLATARRNARLFGTGTDSLYRLGPHEELLGRPVRSLVSPAVERGEVRLDDEEQFQDVRTASPFVPAHIVGEIQDDALPAGAPLAVAVNGRVAATTSSFERNGRRRFAVLVPEQSFRDGPNTVKVFSITEIPGGVSLVRLGGAGHRRTIAARSEG